MMYSTSAWIRGLLCAALALAGLVPLSNAARADEAEAVGSEQTFLIHINGIGGRRSIDRALIAGLEQGGFSPDYAYFDWTEGEIGLVALQGHEKHKAKARELADLIVERLKREPRTSFYITAHSGGAGIAAFALELLPEDVKIESVVFFAPALSPEYDLSKALRHVKKNLHVFSSPLDVVVLSTGTRLFGTIDGVRGDAAGFKGFVKPEICVEPEQYVKVDARPYDRLWLGKYGNAGSHICAMRPKFAREYVAKLLMGKAPAEGVAAGPATRPVTVEAR